MPGITLMAVLTPQACRLASMRPQLNAGDNEPTEQIRQQEPAVLQ